MLELGTPTEGFQVEESLEIGATEGFQEVGLCQQPLQGRTQGLALWGTQVGDLPTNQ